MNQKYILNFDRKGDRDYVQGPDIFDATINKIEKGYYGNLKKIKYSAHNWLKNNADLIIARDIKIYNSKIEFSCDKGSYTGFIVDNNKPIINNIDYSEKYVINNSIINDNEISLFNELDQSLTEILVSMNKFYLQGLKLNGKWIVTKIEYNDWSEIGDFVNVDLKLVLIKNLKNRLTKSIIYLNNNKIGYLYFTLIN